MTEAENSNIRDDKQVNPPIQTTQSDLDTKLTTEIENALGDMSVMDMVDLPKAPTQRKDDAKKGEPQQRKTGSIVSIHGTDVFVEFGPKSQGVCPLSMFESTPALGEKMEFIIQRYDPDDDLLVLARQGEVAKAEWETLEVGQVIEARCTGFNKGGLEMEVAKHKAFMPAGQVDIRHIEDLSVFIGEKMKCEVIEMNRQRARIILSRKAPMEVERAQSRVKLLNSLEVGQQLQATVTSIQPYGAFADIGGIDGLIHISDLSYERIKTPSEIVNQGDQVTVKVLKIDTSQDPPRIGLGIKQTMDDPTVAALEKVSEGDTVSGRVSQIKPFGAFVELSPGVEGLIHISELSHDRIRNVNKIVKQNQVVTVKVLSIDLTTRRISLSLKALQEDAQEQKNRDEDAKMRKMRAQLNKKFGPLKGGIA